MAVRYEFSPTRYTRFGKLVGRPTVYSAVHTEALDGTDKLVVTCPDDLAKGERLVWLDRNGTCHEHIVDNPVRTHDSSGDPLTVANCINSIAETWDDYVDDKRPYGSLQDALQKFCATSRWKVGTCTVSGNAECSAYHASVREGIANAFEAHGGEMVTDISCGSSGVTSRTVRGVDMRGNQSSPKRFTWSKDIIGISRDVGSDNPKTRVYGYGKGVETDSGGFGRRLTFADINGGKAYVEDADASAVWGKPDASGNVMPSVGTFVDDSCDDAATLLDETKSYLESHKVPTVTYKADVIDLAAYGRDWEDVGLGDSVAIIDKGFSDDGLRLTGRVSQIERDLMTNDATVTFGNLSDAVADRLMAEKQRLDGVSSMVAGAYEATNLSDAWLSKLMAGLNEQFNSVGTYMFTSFEKGMIFSSVPLDADGKPTKTPASAIQLNGNGFRISNSVSGGDFVWRAFGTGAGFTADEINAGQLNSIAINNGNGAFTVDASGNMRATSANIKGTIETGDESSAHTLLSGNGLNGLYGSNKAFEIYPERWYSDRGYVVGLNISARKRITLRYDDGSEIDLWDDGLRIFKSGFELDVKKNYFIVGGTGNSTGSDTTSKWQILCDSDGFSTYGSGWQFILDKTHANVTCGTHGEQICHS